MLSKRGKQLFLELADRLGWNGYHIFEASSDQMEPGLRPLDGRLRQQRLDTIARAHPEGCLHFADELDRLLKRGICIAGVCYAAALCASIEAEEKTPGQKTRSPVRMHFRRAAPCLYWTGPVRKILHVRYLPTILVKGGSKKDLSPTV